MTLETEGLTASEQAYFDSHGETDPTGEAPETTDSTEPDVPADDAVLEAETAPEAAPEADKRTKMVPHAALHEAREEAKRVKAELDQVKSVVGNIDAHLRRQFEAQQAAQAPKPQELPPIPDENEDPVGTIAFLKNALVELANNQQRSTQEAQQAQQVNAVVSTYRQAAEQARQHVPDFADAYNHLINSRRMELVLNGIPENQVDAHIKREEVQVAAAAVQRGQNPAEAVYKLAMARGYRRAEAAPAAPQQIQAKAQAQADNVSLGSAGGSPAGGQMTAEKLASMSPEQFGAYMAKNPKTVKALMGG